MPILSFHHVHQVRGEHASIHWPGHFARPGEVINDRGEQAEMLLHRRGWTVKLAGKNSPRRQFDRKIDVRENSIEEHHRGTYSIPMLQDPPARVFRQILHQPKSGHVLGASIFDGISLDIARSRNSRRQERLKRLASPKFGR